MLKNLRRVDIVSVDYLYGVEYIGKLKTAETYILLTFFLPFSIESIFFLGGICFDNAGCDLALTFSA